MKPLKDLSTDVRKLDIDNIEEFNEISQSKQSSLEIDELTRAFNQALTKINKSYQDQKAFSSNVAHELRTPLSVMRAKLDVYKKKGPKDETSRDFIGTMDTNIDRLSNMIDELLFLSRKKNVRLNPVDLRMLIDELVFDIEDKAEEKNIEITTSGNLIVESDDGLLERVLFNLIENAINYTENAGKIDIELGEGKVLIKDTGIGISDKDKEKIFNLLYRADESRSWKTEGYGIGLALVKSICDELNIKISVYDNQPKGSVFELDFN